MGAGAEMGQGVGVTVVRHEMSWPALLPALLVPFFGALIYFGWIPERGIGQAVYTATKMFTLVYPLCFLRLIGSSGLTRREERQARWPSWRMVVLSGLVSGLAIVGLGAVLMLTPLGEMVREGAPEVREKTRALGFAQHFVLFAIFVSVFHSALEEYYWRWFVYGHLREKVGRWAGHAVAALAFGGHHLVVTLQFFTPGLAIFLTLCVIVGGLIWTLMYEWHGTVWGCWISHLCVDVLLMVIGFRMING